MGKFTCPHCHEQVDNRVPFADHIGDCSTSIENARKNPRRRAEDKEPKRGFFKK